MITNAILFIVFGWLVILTYPLRNLPNVSLPFGLNDAIANIGGSFGSVSAYLPITTLLIVFGLFLVVEGYIFSYKIIKWVRRLGG